VKLFYSPDYVLAGYEFDTTRKSQQVAESLQREPISGIEIEAPTPLTESQLCEVHDPAYVTAVRTGQPDKLARSQGFPVWDDGLWPMVCASNGGVVAAALVALADGVSGSLSSGLHHARRERGNGYCTFNGLVLASRAALAAGARSILILDLDAHCGGGTQSLIYDDSRVWHMDVSVSRFDSYPPGERQILRIVTRSTNYLPTIEAQLQNLEETAPIFDLCLYNAGMDVEQRCRVGGLTGITPGILEARESLVFNWCRQRGIPIAFVLAGGYSGGELDSSSLVELHRLSLATAARS
jgi:acetoin utilization deacetylase AcuC-like enzyme